ncbi:hypothetical protein PQQ72_24530 [Paraburkholderia strydomiana]|uniref:hypothetical protein n=1 Tax=Paraburkholderia strydomiana TaxID=1245417 RepID=UPI0038BB4091
MVDMERRPLGRLQTGTRCQNGELFGLQDDARLSVVPAAVALESAAAAAAEALTVSPTTTPDPVHACLDLLIEAESGLLHLSNGDA